MALASTGFTRPATPSGEGSSISEGIGQGRITANLDGFTPDHCFKISDAEALPLIYDLLQHEGLVMGGSTAINMAGAVRMARALGPGHTIVTILCDYGTRYQSKVYNPAFLREKGLPVPDWLEAGGSHVPEVFARTHDPAHRAYSSGSG